MKKIIYLIAASYFFIASCSKKDDDSSTPNNPAPPGNSITVNSAYQVSMKIDGTPYSKISDGVNVQSVYGSNRNVVGFPDTSYASYDVALYNPSTSEFYFMIAKGTLYFQGNFPANTAFRSFYSSGNYSYSPGLTNGISIAYLDSGGIIWSTDQGTADQTGSAFTITENREITGGDYTVVIRATFNCKLYNSTGQSKTVTEGIFVGGFANI